MPPSDSEVTRLTARCSALEFALTEIVKHMPDVGRQLVIQSLEGESARHSDASEYGAGFTESLTTIRKFASFTDDEAEFQAGYREETARKAL